MIYVNTKYAKSKKISNAEKNPAHFSNMSQNFTGLVVLGGSGGQWGKEENILP